MPNPHHFLQNLALVLCAAAATSLIFRWLKLPVVFGYLMAGLLIGPHIPVPLVADEELVRTLAELGVILLMFALGLEFSLRRLLRVGPTAGFIALLETSAMLLAGFAIGQAFGWSTLESVYAGAVIAISSTTIIVKAFGERKTGRVADIVFGVLIFEDLVAILLLALLTTLSPGGGVTAGQLVTTGARLAAFLAGLLVAGLLIVPRLVRATIRLRSPETTLVTAIGICFATALLALAFGYSVALGAFIGGALVAESGHARSIEHLVAPVRDMFVAIFFVAVGMLIDPVLIAQHWVEVLVLTVVVIVGKVAAVSIGVFLGGYGTRTSLQAGMSLAQIGEFSFIIAGIGLSTGATRPFLYPVAVAVSAITTLTTPWLIRASAPVASWVDHRLPVPLQTFAALYGTWLERLRGRGAVGPRSRAQRLVRLVLIDVALVAAVVVTTALQIDEAAAFLMRTLGWAVGDARRAVLAAAALVALPVVFGFVRTARSLGSFLAHEVLPAVAPGKVDLAAAPRRALMITIELAIVVVVGLPLLAITQPFLPPLRGPAIFAAVLAVVAFAWWRSTANLQGHTRAVAEILVSALGRQMAPAPAPVGAASTAPAAQPGRSFDDVRQFVPGLGEPVAHRVDEGDHAAGRTLAVLDLRSQTGAVILAITRDGTPILLPTGHEMLRAGDLLAVAGTRDAVRSAVSVLKQGKES